MYIVLARDLQSRHFGRVFGHFGRVWAGRQAALKTPCFGRVILRNLLKKLLL